MADDTQLGAPSGVGDKISTDDLGAGTKVQRVKVQYGVDGAATDASATNPLPVDQTNTSVADGGTLPAKGLQVGGTDGSVFQVLSTDNAGRLNTNINGTVTTTGTLTDTQLRATPVPVSGTVTASGPLTDTQLRATPVPVSGTVTASGPLTDTQLRATTVPVADSQVIADNAGFTDGTSKVFPVGLIFDEVAGTALTENDIGAARMDSKRAAVSVLEDATTRGQRAAVSAGGALKVDNSAVTQPVSGTVTANLGTAAVTNAGTFAVQIAANSSVNNAQVSGTAVSVNSGTKDAGTQRVILASDQTVVPISDNAGSLTVDAPVGTPAFVTATPSSTGGWSKIKYAAQTTTKQATKASAGTFGGYYVYNPNASVAYIQVFDLASASVTLGTTVPDMIFGIPASSAANLEISNGVNMANAITLACTTTAGGLTAPGTGLDLTIFFK